MAIDKLKKKIAKGRHASTLKRDRQGLKHRARNRSALSRMKSAIKDVRTSGSKEALTKVIPIIMKTGQKGIIHRRKAARLVSRLTKSVAARQA
ncbi:MAG: 30S ribosomal protein S20 [bacterium]